MANERDFELLDDYLTNRLSEEDRSAFEQRLNADPDLQHEYALQKRVIQGIKDARVAQLKSMLNQVPVPSASTGNAIAGKVIVGTLVTLMIAATAIWYYKDEPNMREQATTPILQKEEQSTAPVEEPAISQVQPEKETPRQSVVRENQVQETDKNQTSAGTEHSRPSLAKKPDPLAAPAPTNNDGTKAADAVSIITDGSNPAYSFHYKTENGKLVLFGPFEESSYQVVTLSETGKTLRSLYYKERYYLLNDTNGEVRSLSEVTDASLIGKLEKQRVSE